jgi:peptide/nickel transport system substrate-binding protein
MNPPNYEKINPNSELRVSIDESSGSLFPSGGKWDIRAFSRSNLYSAVLGQLYYLDSKSQLHPGLAQLPLTHDEGATWVFELARDLKFHNGREVTVEDLKFSLERHLISEIDTPEKEFLKSVEEIHILSGQKLRIRLRTPDLFFPHTLSLSEFSLVPEEEMFSDLLSWKTHPIGAGPYRVVSVNEDKNEVAVEWTGSVGPVAQNPPKRIVFATHQRMERLGISLRSLKDPVISNMKCAELSVPDHVRTIFFNYRSRIGSSENFRRAVLLALDPERLASTVEGALVTNDLIPRSLGLRSEERPSRNIDEAKRLLAQEGISEIVLRNRFSSAPSWLRELIEQLEAVGLKVKLDSNPQTPPLASNDESTAFEVLGLVPDAADSLILYKMFQVGGPYLPKLPEADLHYQNLFSEAWAARDDKNRRAKTLDLMNYFNRRVYALPLFEVPSRIYYCGESIRDLKLDMQRQTLVYQVIEMRE